jgi:methyl-accepting chemotaxis protein
LALALGAVLFWPLALRLYDTAITAVERAAAATQLLALHARFWPAFTVVAATFIAHQLIVSHRIAGPLYRIRQVLRSLARGELPPEVRLRKRDMLTEEADELNALISAWRVRAQRASESLARVRGAARQLELAQGEGASAATAELTAALERLSDDLQQVDLAVPLGVESLSNGNPAPALPRGGSEVTGARETNICAARASRNVER